MKLRVAAPLTIDSIVDGPGLRMVIWAQGCKHYCRGCHNPQTHDERGGYEIDSDCIIEQIQSTKLQSGITLSGGEPFLQAEALVPIAQAAKQLGQDVWAYTGFTWGQLHALSNPQRQYQLELLNWIDILVDGRFIEHKKSAILRYKGSSNQRIIDVQASLELGYVVLHENYNRHDDHTS
ncbi:anaerobic ribonucleoside-triphosphate reductase activating protein [Paenibacillus endoradicis]|uniref:anaerobic ribonucleoside-triphosphate reductase activating protein n=1 Tax=Paenibacillus endoradicis TaxID=2972487 RepID=UPI002159A43C|nr:anaerobic ribonucleoside-triphosphate reductase activating protein [Paenibacillus endoradicis]MCR8658750.1 anaerobic ribonucleoside-triphosphate reductase activating protein [Paenibacillus endoradicis]